MEHDETCVLERVEDCFPTEPDPRQDRIPQTTVAIVLAGVHAWGGNGLDRLIARPLLPVADRPLIAHTLGWLRRAGVCRAIVCANSGTRALRACLGDGRRWGVDLEYYEDLFPRGPAGCVRDALSGSRVPVCVVVEGTVLPEFNLGAMLAEHRKSKADFTLAAARPHGTANDTDAPLTPLGVYLASPAALEEIPAHGYQDIKEALIPRLHARGCRVAAHLVLAGQVLRVADAAAYLSANKSVLRRMAARGTPPEGYAVVGEGLVHHSACVDPAAQLKGPVLIGAESIVQASAILSGPTSIGAQCRIGRGAVLSRSVVWDRAVLGDRAIVDQCVITSGAWVEPDLVVRNSVYSEMPARPSRLWDLR